jgi:hypothetical protein
MNGARGEGGKGPVHSGAARRFGVPGKYLLRLRGQLGPEWSEWFGGLKVSCDDGGDTWVEGILADQAALHGLLVRVRDLGVELVSVQRVEPDSQS